MPPFRNPFGRKPPTANGVVQDENIRPSLANGINKEGAKSDGPNSRTSSALSIKAKRDEPSEYKLCGTLHLYSRQCCYLLCHRLQDRCIGISRLTAYSGQRQRRLSPCMLLSDPGSKHLLTREKPSPPEKRSFWQRTPTSTTTSSHRSMLSENEPFSISRESFESYRRSFVRVVFLVRRFSAADM